MNVETGATATRPQARQVTMTLEEALAYAVQRHRDGDLDQAEAIYDLVRERHPERLDVVNYLGILKHQRGELDESLALLRQVVERLPDADGAWNNIGNVLLRQTEVDEAGRGVQAQPRDRAVPAGLGQPGARVPTPRRPGAQRTGLSQRARDGARPWRRHAQPRPGADPAGPLRGGRGVRAARDAAARAARATRPALHASAAGGGREHGQAARVLRSWLVREPDSAYAAHQLAACTGEDTPTRASDAYVEAVFDNFAESFDTTLARLNYCAPDRVTRALHAVLPAAARQLDIADVGCGTGQCGPLLQPWARRLVGCDLSAAMMERARARGVYDDLQKAELTAFLRERPAAYDVVVSADTFIYFGDLRGVARSMRHAVRAGGHVAFSLEAMAASEPGEHVLRPTGRYAHSGDYVRRVLDDAGLQVETMAGEVLREESHVPVQGWIVTARRR